MSKHFLQTKTLFSRRNRPVFNQLVGGCLLVFMLAAAGCQPAPAPKASQFRTIPAKQSISSKNDGGGLNWSDGWRLLGNNAEFHYRERTISAKKSSWK